MKYKVTITTEHGEYGAWNYGSRRLAQLAGIDLRKELSRTGHKRISAIRITKIDNHAIC